MVTRNSIKIQDKHVQAKYQTLKGFTMFISDTIIIEFIN